MSTARNTRRIRIRKLRVAGLVLAVAAALVAAVGFRSLAAQPPQTTTVADILRDAHREAVSAAVWPASGQAAFTRSGTSGIVAGPGQHPAPIASVAKVMTAYLVLRDHPLALGEGGPTLRLTAADAADADERRDDEQSVVPVVAGEQLTELEALQALLLPSANNIAVVLARWDAGSVGLFLSRMNATARSLGMVQTRYTDPSGFEDTTVSTAADQVRVVEQALRLPVFARIVASPSAVLPVAGLVRNTDTLLGYDGFVGVKTGSDEAAGGCFAFRAVRSIDGTPAVITGVVLGQPGRDRIGAGLEAAATMVDRLVGRSPITQLPHRVLPPPEIAG